MGHLRPTLPTSPQVTGEPTHPPGGDREQVVPLGPHYTGGLTHKTATSAAPQSVRPWNHLRGITHDVTIATAPPAIVDELLSALREMVTCHQAFISNPHDHAATFAMDCAMHNAMRLIARGVK